MISEEVANASMAVWDVMGAGHSETIYEAALNIELHLRDIPSRRQVPVNLSYKGWSIGTGFIDLLVFEDFVVEIKSVAKLSLKDELQVRKYLAATGLERGLLINFGNDLEIVEVRKVDHEQTISTEG